MLQALAYNSKNDGLMDHFFISINLQRFVDEWLSAGRPMQVQFLGRKEVLRGWPQSNPGFTCWRRSCIYPIVSMGLIHPKCRIAAINSNMTWPGQKIKQQFEKKSLDLKDLYIYRYIIMYCIHFEIWSEIQSHTWMCLREKQICHLYVLTLCFF